MVLRLSTAGGVAPGDGGRCNACRRRRAESRRQADAAARVPFELAGGPLLRVALVRLTPDEHAVLLTLHHIVADGWSMAVFIQEVGALYEAFHRGRPVALPELAVQYADFARWQRDWLQGAVLEEQLDYWRQCLRDLPVLQLPTDRPRTRESTAQGAIEYGLLSAATVQRLEQLGRSEDGSLFMVLLAGFQVLLGRYAHVEDVAVGSAIAGRNRTETEGLIGFFVNSLVMRTDLSGDPTFRELLGRVRETVLGAFASPGPAVREAGGRAGAGTRRPAEPAVPGDVRPPEHARRRPAAAGLKLSPVPVEQEAQRFDLEVHVAEHGDDLLAVFMYKTDLFDAATIARMVRRYVTLLETLAALPDRQLGEIELDAQEGAPALPELRPGAAIADPAQLSFHQERLWFIDQFETGKLYQSAPVYHNIR